MQLYCYKINLLSHAQYKTFFYFSLPNYYDVCVTPNESMLDLDN